MGNILKTVSSVGSVIPGPWQPWAAGASALLGSIDSNKQQGAGNRAMKGMEGLTQEQIKMLQSLNPQLLANAKDAQNQYQQYDPHQETERAMTAYDQAANASVASDYGNARVPTSLRGLSGSSEATGAQQLVGAQRSGARGKLASDLTLGERDRKQGALSFANGITQQAVGGVNSYQGAINNLGGQANAHYGQAASYDPSAQIKMFGEAFKNIKLPWLKKQIDKPTGWPGNPGGGPSPTGNY